MESIARAQRIEEEITARFGTPVVREVTISDRNVADLVAVQKREVVAIVLLSQTNAVNLSVLRTVAEVSVVAERGTLEGATVWPKLGRARWFCCFGECKRIADWARDSRCRVPAKSLRRRIDEGWCPEVAMTEPPKKPVASKQKQQKPYSEFPLQRHKSGQWCKKIAGRLYYFGSGTWQEALERFQKEHDSIRLGKRIVETPTVGDLVNAFLESKKTAEESGELATRTFNDYHAICGRIVSHFGTEQPLGQLLPFRFTEFRKALQEGVSVITLGNRVRMCRVVFRFAHESRLIDRPIDLANCFNLPPAKAARKQRWDRQQQDGFRMFDPEEIGSLLEVLENPLRSMVLLGLNCGLGNTDCAELTRNAINLEKGWLTFPRPKTMVMRDCPLWPETVEALREQLVERPAARTPDLENRVFLTRSGRPWVKITKNGANDDAIAKEFSKVLKDLEIKRPGLNFYALRHTFQTVGESSGDLVAVRSIMGHVDTSMSGAYREYVSEERLRAVVDTVRRTLLSVQQ